MAIATQVSIVNKFVLLRGAFAAPEELVAEFDLVIADVPTCPSLVHLRAHGSSTLLAYPRVRSGPGGIRLEISCLLSCALCALFLLFLSLGPRMKANKDCGGNACPRKRRHPPV